MFKTVTKRKKLKPMGHNTFHESLPPGMDRWESLIFHSCHANQSNKYYMTLIQGCIDESCNIPGLKQPNVHEQRNTSMK